MQSITVVGLTTTTLLIANQTCTQYTLTVLSHGRHQEYIFTPNTHGKYDFRVNYIPYPSFEVKCSQPTEMQWLDNVLYLSSPQTKSKLYDTETKEFHNPEQFFAPEKVNLPPRTVLVIAGYSDLLLPLLNSNLKVAFTDTWERIPSIIPEDIIVMQNKQIPLAEISLRMPPNTRLMLVNPSVTHI